MKCKDGTITCDVSDCKTKDYLYNRTALAALLQVQRAVSSAVSSAVSTKIQDIAAASQPFGMNAVFIAAVTAAAMENSDIATATATVDSDTFDADYAVVDTIAYDATTTAYAITIPTFNRQLLWSNIKDTWTAIKANWANLDPNLIEKINAADVDEVLRLIG